MEIFTGHPRSVGETYFQHGLKSLGYALRLFRVAVACMVHAFFPFLFKNTASEYIKELNQQMMSRTTNDILEKLTRAKHPTNHKR